MIDYLRIGNELAFYHRLAKYAKCNYEKEEQNPFAQKLKGMLEVLAMMGVHCDCYYDEESKGYRYNVESWDSFELG